MFISPSEIKTDALCIIEIHVNTFYSSSISHDAVLQN